MLVLIIAAAAAAGAPTSLADAADGGQKPDKVVCKSFAKTQTRIGRIRVCKPRSEWEYVQREQERELDQIQIDNTRMEVVAPPPGKPY